MRHDLISDVFFSISNADNIGKKDCTVPGSKIVKAILATMQSSGYIGNFKPVSDGKSIIFKVQLLGKINTCRSVKPRHAVTKNEYKKWESRYLPAKNFGILILTTSEGIINQKDAEKKGVGGRLLGYVY